jgi:heterodisulfide reductase subunit A-like polyferredoxin
MSGAGSDLGERVAAHGEGAPMTEQPGPGSADGRGGRRIGVYVCHCGGNISDYVDVDRVIADIRDAGDVVVARTAMFACSDASQQDMVHDIEEQGLDGLVVASCSPKLHTYTFRGVAARAGLNPYEYTQVNIREQCSWVHTDDGQAATAKATDLVRAGIARTRFTTSNRSSSRRCRTPWSSAAGSPAFVRRSASRTSASG